MVDAVVGGDRGPLKQLAADLSGVVSASGGRFSLVFSATTKGAAAIEGRIDPVAGLIGRTFIRDLNGDLIVSNDGQFLPRRWQGKGFARALTPRLEAYYQRSGVDRIEVHAADEIGGYAWASQGFVWDPDPERLKQSIGNIVQRAGLVMATVGSKDARQALGELVEQLVDGHGAVRSPLILPTPREIAELATSEHPKLGKVVMLNSNWYGWKKLR